MPTTPDRPEEAINMREALDAFQVIIINTYKNHLRVAITPYLTFFQALFENEAEPSIIGFWASHILGCQKVKR